MKRIPEGQTIALDTMVFIYHLEDHPGFSAITERLLDGIEKEKYRAVTSYITLLEILVKPKRDGLNKAVTDYRDLLLTFPNLRFIPVGKQVADIASTLRAKYGIRTPDAVQIATALSEGAKVFVTNDSQLKKVAEIQVVLLEELRR
ncbi:MAG TPA: type II toxin-antitoxin system VapC family toxin [Dissulfurispiraceae bacterium]|nr:type II toxin-antitoxin system VapC family toxin [Dissulfurispiraceae bacterium]